MVKVLVCGSEGFIGRRFTAMFAHAHDVIAGERDESGAFQDLTVPATAARMLERHRPDAILNLAGKSYHTAADNADIYESNALAEAYLHEAVARLGIEARIVLCSSSAVYESSAAPVEESSPCAPVNAYAKAKYIQERVGLSYHPAQHVVIARLFNVIGPRQSKDFFIPAIIDRIVRYKRGETETVVLKTRNAMRDFVYIDDVCRALGVLLERGRSGETYNVCSGTGVSIDEVIERLEKILGISKIPLAPLDGEVREGIGYQIGSNRRIRDLGWKPEHGIEQSLAEIVREEYGI